MLGRNKKKMKSDGDTKPERISNRLNRILIAESRQSAIRKWRTFTYRQRLVIKLIVLIVLVGMSGLTYAWFGREKPAPTPTPVAPTEYDESTGSIIFEYKPEQ